MPAMQIDRAVVEQALEALESVDWYVNQLEEIVYSADDAGTHEERAKAQPAIAALRATLAQQVEPQGCATEEDCTKQPWCRIRGECQRKQAEPLEPVAGVVLNEEGRAALVEYGREERHCVVCNARRLYTAPPKDEPKPMHPELRKMWEDHFDKCFRAMPVPKQAEPVEPVAWNWMLDGQPYGQAYYGRPPDADIVEISRLREDRTVRLLYTAPPQRKPLPKHDQHCVDVPGYGLMAVRLVRAVERAHGIKE